ncbi:MAG: ABC transporter permease, partial [Parahaliea sp.]
MEASPRAVTLALEGDWRQDRELPDVAILTTELAALAPQSLSVDGTGLGEWDSLLMAFLLQCHNHCQVEQIAFSHHNLPDGVRRLLAVATAVPRHERPVAGRPPPLKRLNPVAALRRVWLEVRDSIGFFGDLNIALARLFTGRATTRFSDFRQFCYDAGPGAFAIITLTSFLVGMILAYLGAVQLKMLGAEIYVANLVAIGMLREMG